MAQLAIKGEANRKAELNQQRPNRSRMDCVPERNAELLEKQLSLSKRKVKRWQGRFSLTLYPRPPAGPPTHTHRHTHNPPSCIFHILYS